MKFHFAYFFILILVVESVTLAAPKSAPEQPKIAQKDRTEIFKRALAYLPSIMFSTMGKFPVSRDEANMFVHIANLATLNLNMDSAEEFMLPDKYKLFVVKESSDQRYFDLEPGETIRTASTKPYIHEPIMVNTNIINDPQVEISLPYAVQLLIHEIARKIPGGNMQAAERYAAKVANAIKQDYMVIDIAPNEKLHILNSPIRYAPPALAPTDKDYEGQVNNFKSHQVRSGREIMIFYENERGFSYVPSLKTELMEGLKVIKVIPKQNQLSTSTSAINIESIRVDRGISRRPVVRFLFSIFERAYRVSKESKEENGKDVKTGELILSSFSTLNVEGAKASEGDEVMKTYAEVAIIFNQDGTVKTRRREVLPQSSEVKITDLKYQQQGKEILGSFVVQVPSGGRNALITPDLRAYLWARMGVGLVRIEVMRLIPEGNILKIDFKIPSSEGTTQSYGIEEVILKNQNTEFIVDLPETIIVKKPELKEDKFEIKKLERKVDDGWMPLELREKTEADHGPNQSLDKLDQIEGLIKVKPGNHRFRMLIKSQALLQELHVFIRGMYLTHDPMTRTAFGQYLAMPEPFRSAILKVTNGLQFQSASHFQMIDKAFHLPASELRQVQKAGYVWVEFDLPMEIMPDKGLNTFDTGIRYTGKIIAVNQRMERLELEDLRHPLFGVEGTSWGANSCGAHFK